MISFNFYNGPIQLIKTGLGSRFKSMWIGHLVKVLEGLPAKSQIANINFNIISKYRSNFEAAK